MLRLQIFVVERCIVQYSTTRLYQHTDCSEVMSMLSEHPYEAILLVGIWATLPFDSSASSNKYTKY